MEGSSRENLDFALSKTSALNERYFDEDINLTSVDLKAPYPADNLGLSKTSRLNERYEVGHKAGLSETSKLNKRYMGKSKSSEQLDHEPDLDWDKYGLSKSSLNVRYFQAKDEAKAAAVGNGSDMGSELQAPSSQMSDEDIRDEPDSRRIELVS